jgi:hypothetical protein
MCIRKTIQDETHKLEGKTKPHTVATVPKFNINIVERGKIDT